MTAVVSLADSLAFNLEGSLLPANGAIPNYSRPTVAYSPVIDSGGYQFIGNGIDQARFNNEGGLLLEPASRNLISNPTSFSVAEWVKGSVLQVREDVLPSMTQDYRADVVISGGGATGASDSHSMYRTFNLLPGVYTLSVYLALYNGSYTENDRIYVVDGNFRNTDFTINLNEVDGINLSHYWGDLLQGTTGPFTGDNRKYKRVVLQFAVGGTTPKTNTQGSVIASVNIPNENVDSTLFGENDERDITYPITIVMSFGGGASTTGLGGMQLERHPFPTSFIEGSRGGNLSRAEDRLIYPRSPFVERRDGALQVQFSDWTCRFFLDQWDGDGMIFSAGDVRCDIVQGKLRVRAGTYTLQDNMSLPQRSSVVIRNKGRHSLRLYVNEELRAQIVFSSNQEFKATESPLSFVSEGVRVLRNFLVFTRAFDDGIEQVPTQNGVNINLAVNPILAVGDLQRLFDIDFNVIPAENRGSITFTPINLLEGERRFVRYPQVRSFSSVISDPPPALTDSGQEQQVRCQVTVGGDDAAFENVAIRGWVEINGVRIDSSTVLPQASGGANRTNAEKREVLALDLVTKIEALLDTPRLRYLGINYTVDTDNFVIFSQEAGRPFTIATSTSIAKQTLFPNLPGVGDLPVNFPQEFLPGPVYVQRDYKEIATLTVLTTGADDITVKASPSALFGLLQEGDVLYQSKWDTHISPNNCLVGVLEQISGVVVEAKSIDGFTIRNDTGRPVTVTPYLKTEM